MKAPLLLVSLLIAGTSFSQYCGNSGPGQCIPSGTIYPIIFTPSEDIPCLLRGQSMNTIIQFDHLDSMVAPSGIAIDSVRFDSIENLPSGLCWNSNASDNSFSTQGSDCIHISGVTYAPPGQYKLRTQISFHIQPVFGGWVGGYSLDDLGIKIYLRLVDQSFAICPPLDTTQTDSVPYLPLSGHYQNEAQISGKLYFDVNQNQVFDGGEQPVRNQLFSLNNNYAAISAQNGNFNAYAPVGVYTIKPLLSGNIATFSFNPDSIIMQVDSVGVIYSGYNFGIIAPPGYCEGTLNLVALSPPPRPGFTNDVRVSYTNIISAAAVSNTISFTYDANQRYVSAFPVPVADTVNRRLTWSTAGIASGTTIQMRVTLYTPPTVATGTVLHYSSFVSVTSCQQTDVPQTDQESVVVGSYDPNDKAVSPAGVGSTGRVLPSTAKLSYTIRFQNTGTYLAENVNIIDTISPHLNLATLKVLTASHDYEVIIKGREVTFRFAQIMLPDSNANEPQSHGYIQYSIEPASTFVQNTVIENTAYIYFDFNAPVVTNTTTTTADESLAVTNVSSGELQFEVYPNPLSSGNWQLVTGSEAKGMDARIYDVTGRLIQSVQISNTKTEVDASRLSKGAYIIRIGNSAARVIKL